MSKTDRWFPFDVGAYLGDTMHLTTVQHGAYVLLLMHYWRKGPLPNDDGIIAAIARLLPSEWQQMAGVIRQFFTVGEDGLLHQKRADAELDRSKRVSAKRSEAGRSGAEARHAGKRDGNTDGKALANAKQMPPQRQIQIQEEDSEANASGADAPVPPTMRDTLWRDGIPILRRLTGQSDKQARGLLGKMLRDCHDDCAKVYSAIREADDLQPVDPVQWLMKATSAKGRAPPAKQARLGWLVDELGLEEAA